MSLVTTFFHFFSFLFSTPSLNAAIRSTADESVKTRTRMSINQLQVSVAAELTLELPFPEGTVAVMVMGAGAALMHVAVP